MQTLPLEFIFLLKLKYAASTGQGRFDLFRFCDVANNSPAQQIKGRVGDDDELGSAEGAFEIVEKTKNCGR